MDEDGTLDFKALRARFQEEELLLKTPKVKPAVPEKPRVVPPPQSPPHYLPAGARPSLLTSINQSLDGKSPLAPRVVFRDEKKESKKPLIPSNFKKEKMKGSMETLIEDPPAQRQKTDGGKEKKLSLALPVAELVPAAPPPAAPKKKGFLGFKKLTRGSSVEIPSEPILDTSSLDITGPVPLIPVPSDFVDSPTQPEVSAPKALLPNIPSLPNSTTTTETTPPFVLPTPPDPTPPSAFIPDYPAPEVPAPGRETPPQIETSTLSISRPNETIPDSAVPTPPLSHAFSGPPAVAPTPSPEPEIVAEAGTEKPPPSISPPSTQGSPRNERPISALSFLERAEDMNLGKRTPADQRVFNALEKARKKISSPPTNQTTCSITPPPEELPSPQSSTHSGPEFPPIDYAGKALPLRPGQVNGFDHRQASPVLEGIAEEGRDAVPDLFVAPPPPPKKLLPDPVSLGPAPEKPARPPFVNLSEFPPPSIPQSAVDENAKIPASLDVSETDTADVPEFDNVDSLAHSPELPVSEWGNGEYTGPDALDDQNHLEYYSNGITTPGTLGEEYQNHLQPLAGPEGAEAANGYMSTGNLSEDLTTKKKAKSDGGKKRKGPPQNPYAEVAQETNEEKIKTGRSSKNEKKAPAEGPDEKELKKREKQRMEKEKKELKEKQEREKKEQKEREKKESEIRKKFKITGQEDAMYQATVTVTSKGRKNDLPVKSGDIVSVIRTTNCPKGKWLARDSSNNYGYVAVDHVELDIKEMLELGKKAAITRKTSSNVMEGEVTSPGSRASNHFPLSAGSFTDDSEEWTGDDDETVSPVNEDPNPFAPVAHTRTLSMPDMGNKDLSINHQHSHSDIIAEGPHMQARHEALQKLATFFCSPKPGTPTSHNSEVETSPDPVKEESVHLPESHETHKVDLDPPDMPILPPPDLYADFITQ